MAEVKNTKFNLFVKNKKYFKFETKHMILGTRSNPLFYSS